MPGVEAIVDLDGGWGEALRAEIERWQAALPGRVAVFAGPGLRALGGRPGVRRDRGAAPARRRGGGRARASRSGSCSGCGPATRAGGWSRSTIRASTRCGRRPASSACRSRSTSRTRSRSSSRSTQRNERWEELRDHPDWHFWPTRPRGDARTLDGFPPFDELIDGLEAVVARHPGTTFIGAHVGCAAEDLARVSTILERCPNFHVDLAARIAELGRQPYTAREFIVRWSDRVLFGTDMAPDEGWWAVYYRFLESADESFAYTPDPDGIPDQGRWRIHGLHLPDDVLAPRLPRERRCA